MTVKSGRVLLLPIIVACIDTILKIVSMRVLEYGQQVPFFPGISLLLVYNKTPYNSVLHALGYANNVYVLFGSFFYLAFGILILIIPKVLKNKPLRGLLYLVFIIMVSVSLNALMRTLKSDIAINPYVVSLIRFIGPLFVSSICVFSVHDGIYKYLWGMYLGGGLGNFLSLLYPPFSVVDYLYVESCRGIGVFNFADSVLTASVVGLFVYTVFVLLRKGIAFAAMIMSKMTNRDLRE